MASWTSLLILAGALVGLSDARPMGLMNNLVYQPVNPYQYAVPVTWPFLPNYRSAEAEGYGAGVPMARADSTIYFMDALVHRWQNNQWPVILQRFPLLGIMQQNLGNVGNRLQNSAQALGVGGGSSQSSTGVQDGNVIRPIFSLVPPSRPILTGFINPDNNRFSAAIINTNAPNRVTAAVNDPSTPSRLSATIAGGARPSRPG